MRKKKKKLLHEKIVIRSTGEIKVSRLKGVYELRMTDGNIEKAQLIREPDKNGYEVYRINERLGCVYIPALGLEDAKNTFNKIFNSQIKPE